MKIHNFSLPTTMLIIVCIVSLMIPLLLALIPIRRGLSVTVKEAIGSIGTKVFHTKKDIITARLENKVSRPVLFSIRSAMANRRRFVTNVAMMTLGGLMFSIITAESIYTCLFSFAICLLLSVPVGALAIQIIGVHILEIPLAISPLIILAALIIWLVVTLIVGRSASKKAAKNAADLTTKDALTFE